MVGAEACLFDWRCFVRILYGTVTTRRDPSICTRFTHYDINAHITCLKYWAKCAIHNRYQWTYLRERGGLKCTRVLLEECTSSHKHHDAQVASQASPQMVKRNARPETSLFLGITTTQARKHCFLEFLFRFLTLPGCSLVTHNHSMDKMPQIPNFKRPTTHDMQNGEEACEI